MVLGPLAIESLSPVPILEATEHESSHATFTIALLTIATLSILGCLFNIIVTLLLKLHHNVLGKMMIYLSANDALFTLCFAYSHIQITSMFMSGFTVSVYAGSVSWITRFAHALYYSVKHGEDYLNNAVLKKYVISSIIVPAIGGALFAIYSLGELGEGWLILPLFSTTMLPIVSMIYCGFCYGFVLRVFRRYQINTHSELLLYPILLLICELPFVITQLHALLADQLLLRSIEDTVNLILISRGICNSLAYGLSSKLKQGFKVLCKQSPLGIPLLESVAATSTYTFVSNNESVVSAQPPNFILKSMTISAK